MKFGSLDLMCSFILPAKEDFSKLFYVKLTFCERANIFKEENLKK